MEIEPKKYELTYLLKISIPEEGVLDHAQKAASAIEAEKGMISRSEMPRKRRLAYPVLKDTQAYMGWIKFTALPTAIASIQKRLKLDTSILRFLVVEDVIPTMTMPHIPRMAPATPAAAPKREEEPQERLDLEELDKKLEEILGK